MLPRHSTKSTFKPRAGYMRRAGKKGKTWNRVRRQLKCKFVGMGVTTCELGFEGCMVNDGLGFAHALKRRHITNDEDMREVVLACNRCHDRLDVDMSHEEMARIVRDTIARRQPINRVQKQLAQPTSA